MVVVTVLIEGTIRVSMRGLPNERFSKNEALACAVWVEMNNNGSLRGGIGAGCPGTGEYDHEGSSAGRVS